MPNRDQWRGFGRGETGRSDRGDTGGSSGAGAEGRSFGNQSRDTARDPASDPVFRTQDARLDAELRRHERERGRARPPEYGHDQNYRPGYHEGGSRFGFFGLEPGMGAQRRGVRGSAAGGEGREVWSPGGGEPYGELRMQGRNRGVEKYGVPADYAFHPAIDQDFDPDYLHWRAQQLQRHDRDYADWRRHQLEEYDEEYLRFRAERRDDFHQRFQDWRAQRDAERERQEQEAAAAAAAPPPDDKI